LEEPHNKEVGQMELVKMEDHLHSEHSVLELVVVELDGEITTAKLVLQEQHQVEHWLTQLVELVDMVQYHHGDGLQKNIQAVAEDQQVLG
jgi:hypothetical protein